MASTMLASKRQSMTCPLSCTGVCAMKRATSARRYTRTSIFVCENGLTHTQVDARFPSFHRDIARGKSSENRAYVLKDGPKFNKQPDGSYSYKDTGGHLHEGVNFSDTFEEGGEMPVERQGKSRDADIIVGMIKDGATNEEIVNTVASAYRDLEKVERVRSMYRDAQFKNCWRELEVSYIFGRTGSGKTRGVMDCIRL